MAEAEAGAGAVVVCRFWPQTSLSSSSSVSRLAPVPGVAAAHPALLGVSPSTAARNRGVRPGTVPRCSSRRISLFRHGQFIYWFLFIFLFFYIVSEEIHVMSLVKVLSMIMW